MRAVDTNVIARALMRDDPVQTVLADDVLATEAFVPITVVLEAGWLLGSRYRLSRSDVATALRALLDMPNVAVESPTAVAWALSRFAEGGDLADLIHLVSARGASAFLTFDRSIAEVAGPDTPVRVETLA